MFKEYHFSLPTMGQSWLMLVFIVGGQLLASFIVMPLMTRFPESGFVTKALPYALSFIPALLFAYLLGRNKKVMYDVTADQGMEVKLNAPSFGRMNPVLFFIVIGIALYAFSMFMDPLVTCMNASEWFKKIMETMMGGGFFWSFFTVAICAPILEEFICRGIICRGLLTRFSPATAIIVSALIFAIMHMNPWQAVPAFILGCFFGWIYYKTGCLWATIFLHFLNNGFSTIMTYIFPELASSDSFRTLIPDGETYWLLFSLSVGILALAFFFLNKYLPKNGTIQKTISA